jgi:hypothetical protein
MQNIIATTVQMSEGQVRISLASILFFLLLALISYHAKYKTITKMRLINTSIILFALIPLVMIADAIRGSGGWVIALIGYSALNVLLIRTDFTKSNFKYAVIVIFTTLMVYWGRAVIMFG